MQLIKDIIIDNYVMFIIMFSYLFLGIGIGAYITNTVHEYRSNKKDDKVVKVKKKK